MRECRYIREELMNRERGAVESEENEDQDVEVPT
jgi:hypothetical protein